MSVLQGLRIIEIAGLGPGPFCGMLLADLGADVIVVERKDATTPLPRPDYIVNRGKRSIALDLKQPQAIEVVLRLVERADALIEGMRPGVMERLGLAPEVCLEHRPSLIYGRMTGGDNMVRSLTRRDTTGTILHCPALSGTQVLRVLRPSHLQP